MHALQKGKKGQGRKTKINKFKFWLLLQNNSMAKWNNQVRGSASLPNKGEFAVQQFPMTKNTCGCDRFIYR